MSSDQTKINRRQGLSQQALTAVLRKLVVKVLQRRPVTGIELLMDLAHIELCPSESVNRFDREAVTATFSYCCQRALAELIDHGLVQAIEVSEFTRYQLVQIAASGLAVQQLDHEVAHLVQQPIEGGVFPKPPSLPLKLTDFKAVSSNAPTWTLLGAGGLLVAGCVSSVQTTEQLARPRYSYFVPASHQVLGVERGGWRGEGSTPTAQPQSQVATTDQNIESSDRAQGADLGAPNAWAADVLEKSRVARSDTFKPSLRGSVEAQSTQTSVTQVPGAATAAKQAFVVPSAVQPIQADLVAQADQAKPAGSAASGAAAATNFRMDDSFASAKRVVPFSYSAANFGPQARAVVEQLLPLARMAERVRVRGNTDASGLASVNKQLATNRALAVTRSFVAGGVSPNKITTTYCTNCFIAGNDTDAGRMANRRVDVELILPSSRVASLPSAYEKHAGPVGTIPEPERRRQ